MATSRTGMLLCINRACHTLRLKNAHKHPDTQRSLPTPRLRTPLSYNSRQYKPVSQSSLAAYRKHLHACTQLVEFGSTGGSSCCHAGCR